MMYFFFSGEGKTDIGTDEVHAGPVAIIADQIIEEYYGYSPIKNSEWLIFVHRAKLKQVKLELRTSPRSPVLRGRKTPSEKRIYRKDASALARVAKCHIQDKDDKEFVAVLFRDSDSPVKKEWEETRQAIQDGFQDQSIGSQGVAAVARPISEAWWLSAIYRKENQAQDCRCLEERTYGNGADHALKIKLEEKLGTTPNRAVLNEMVTDRDIDYKLIDSESFHYFLCDFRQAVGLGYLNSKESAP